MHDDLVVRQLHGRIEEILESQALIGLLLLDTSGVVVYANPTVCSWLGNAGLAAGETNFRELMSGGGRLFFDTQLEPIMRLHGQWREVALELVTSDQLRVPVLASATRCPADESGTSPVLITLFRATERRRYEQELLRARQAAEETAQALFDEKERGRVTLDSLGEGVLVIDADGKRACFALS